MQNDFIITLAWPEGWCAAPGSWYDKFASTNGKYKVGHSALVLINSKTKTLHYFDFGRYHTPEGYGRARDVETDTDLKLMDAEIQNGELVNTKSILLQISKMNATHGEGKMYASILAHINFKKAFLKAKSIQEKGMIAYGPFIWKGSNCSRFVSTVIKSSEISFIKKLRFKYPFCVVPTPKRNVSIANNDYYIVDNNNCIEVKKSKLKAYFSSIEQ